MPSDHYAIVPSPPMFYEIARPATAEWHYCLICGTTVVDGDSEEIHRAWHQRRGEGLGLT